jgi:hypothetical protein
MKSTYLPTVITTAAMVCLGDADQSLECNAPYLLSGKRDAVRGPTRLRLPDWREIDAILGRTDTYMYIHRALRSQTIAPFQRSNTTKLIAIMKVLLIGATGNLGLRLIAALLTHGHIVVAFVRSTSKLESLVPASVYQQISVVGGDAKDPASIKRAILENSCDAVVNTAGVAALPPWGNSDLPAIFRAVLDGVREAGFKRKNPLRTWFLAGLGVLYYPGTESMLSS